MIGFQLSESTLIALLELTKFKEQVMSALNTLQAETAETKAAVASIGTAVNGLIEKYNTLAAQLLEAVTPAQMEAAKAELDAVQAEAKGIADAINAVVNPAPPAPPPVPPVTEPTV